MSRTAARTMSQYSHRHSTLTVAPQTYLYLLPITMARLTPEERRRALGAIDRQRCRRRPILFRKADEYAKLAHAQVFLMVRYQCHVISKTRTYIYHSDPESNFPRLPWQKLRVQDYPRPEVLTPADFGKPGRNNKKPEDNGGARDGGEDEDEDESEIDNNTSEAVVASQSTEEQHATGACPATGPALSRAAGSRPFASRLATSPDPSRFVFDRPATSSPLASSSRVDHDVASRPITPPFVGPHALAPLAPLTPGLGAHDPVSWSSPSPVGSLAFTPSPVGPPTSTSPAPLPLSHGPVTPPFTRSVFSPVLQNDSTGPTIFKHTTGPFASGSPTSSPTPQIKTEQDDTWPAPDPARSDINTTQPNMPDPSSIEVGYRAREQGYGVAEPSAVQRFGRGGRRGRLQARRLRRQGST